MWNIFPWLRGIFYNENFRPTKIFVYDRKSSTWTWTFTLSSRICWNFNIDFYFLKLRLKKLHIFLSLMICGYLFIIFSNFFNDRKVTTYLIALMFSAIFYGIIIIIEKWLMEYKFISPYFLMGHMGVIVFFIQLLFLFLCWHLKWILKSLMRI